MNDNVCAVNAKPVESLRDAISDQSRIIESINVMLDDFTGNTFPDNASVEAPREPVCCYADAIEDNRRELCKARDKLNRICAAFFG